MDNTPYLLIDSESKCMKHMFVFGGDWEVRDAFTVVRGVIATQGGGEISMVTFTNLDPVEIVLNTPSSVVVHDYVNFPPIPF